MLPPPPPPPSPIVAGVNLDTLLSPPTADERTLINAELTQRSQAVVPEGFRIESQNSGEDATVQVVSFTSPFPAGLGRCYGAVRIPPIPSGSAKRLPILLVIPAGEGSVSTAQFLTTGPYTQLGEAFIQVIFAAPGATLRNGSREFDSSPMPGSFFSLYDYEVDLVRALMQSVLDSQSDIVDLSRIGYVGFGRGGTVAFLLASRPLSSAYPFQAKSIAALAPFADYTAPSFRNVVRRVLLDQRPQFPGIESIAERYIRPLRDRERPRADVREAFLRWSPVFDAPSVSSVFLRHGEGDIVIGSDHSDRLASVLSGENYLSVTEQTHEGLFEDQGVRRSVANFLLREVAGED